MSEWISVEDRIPPDGDRILVCIKKPRIGRLVTIAVFNNDKSVVDNSKLYWLPSMNQRYARYISHWMPLPKPPEVKDEY